MASGHPSHRTSIMLPDELRSERMRLRPLHPGDAEAVFAAIDEAREPLRPWIAWVDNHQSVEDARDYCVRCAAKWLIRDDLSLGIFDAASGAYLGGTGLHRLDWEIRLFEIGYWIRQTVQGRGYVSDAVRLLTALAFEHLPARRLEIRCDATNERSRRVAERAGFVFEGRLRNDSLSVAREPRDTLVFSLIPEDYQRLIAASEPDSSSRAQPRDAAGGQGRV